MFTNTRPARPKLLLRHHINKAHHQLYITVSIRRARQSSVFHCLPFSENCSNLEIIWNANLMQQGNFINVFLARYVSGTYVHHQEHWMLSCSIWFSASSFWKGGCLESCCEGRVCGADGARHHPQRKHTLRSSSQDNHPSKLGAENHMLQLNIQCSWWWAYVPETCRGKNTLIKLPCCFELAFQIISWGRCTVKQPPRLKNVVNNGLELAVGY